MKNSISGDQPGDRCSNLGRVPHRWTRNVAWSTALLLAAPAWGQSFAPSGMASPATVAPASAGSLQSLVNEADFQIRLTFRHNRSELERRRAELAAGVAKWRAAARNDANNRRMAEWLRTAIRNSMPGSGKSSPPLPEFDSRSVAIPMAPDLTSPSTTRQKPVVTEPPGSAQSMSDDGVTATSGASGPSAESDFWSDHPANTDLPAELSGGDPFRDDPPAD
jgi:hypothetical protein